MSIKIAGRMQISVSFLPAAGDHDWAQLVREWCIPAPMFVRDFLRGTVWQQRTAIGCTISPRERDSCTEAIWPSVHTFQLLSAGIGSFNVALWSQRSVGGRPTDYTRLQPRGLDFSNRLPVMGHYDGKLCCPISRDRDVHSTLSWLESAPDHGAKIRLSSHARTTGKNGAPSV
jgi:hypothetical protein